MGEYNPSKHEGLSTYFPYQDLLIRRNRYTRFEVNLPDFGCVQVHCVEFSCGSNIFPTLYFLYLYCHFPVAGQFPFQNLTIADMKRTDQIC